MAWLRSEWRKPWRIFPLLWTLGFPFSSPDRTSGLTQDLSISVSFCLSFCLSSVHLYFRQHWIQAMGYQWEKMICSPLVWWHFNFRCSFLILLLIPTFQRPWIAIQCVMCRFYCCICRRKSLLCVYSILPRTGILACFYVI